MNLISLLTAFVPWIAFTLVAEAPLGSPLTCLTLAFVVGIVLTVLTSYRQISRGISFPWSRLCFSLCSSS